MAKMKDAEQSLRELLETANEPLLIEVEFCPNLCCHTVEVRAVDGKPLSIGSLLAGLSMVQQNIVKAKLSGEITNEWQRPKKEKAPEPPKPDKAPEPIMGSEEIH